jgi:hypothetical protein
MFIVWTVLCFLICYPSHPLDHLPSTTSNSYQGQRFTLPTVSTDWMNRGSSVSVVSGYGLDDRVIGFRSLAEAKDFSSSLCAQTGSGAHPASYPMGTGGPFPRGKVWPGRDTDHSSPSSTEVKNEKELYLLSPTSASMLHFTVSIELHRN